MGGLSWVDHRVGKPYQNQGYHKAFDLPTQDVIHASCPHYFRFAENAETEEHFVDRLIDELKQIISREGADTVAAFIAEPIMGTGGVIIPT